MHHRTEFRLERVHEIEMASLHLRAAIRSQEKFSLKISREKVTPSLGGVRQFCEMSAQVRISG